MIDVSQIDYILKNVVTAIKQSQEQINDINDRVLKEWEALQRRLADIQYRINALISEVDTLEELLAESRKRLAEVSKNFKKYKEEDIRAAYNEANELKIKLALNRQLEKQLREQRNSIEQQVRSAKIVLEKSENVNAQINMALALLTGDLGSITAELHNIQFKEFMSTRIILAQEEERRRLARDIHDGPAQSLSNLLLKTELCDRLIDTDSAAAKKELAELKEMIRSSIREIRKVIFDLRPMSLDDLGLISTITQYAEDFERENGVNVELKIKGDPPSRIKSVVEVAAFRIIQEALNNILKHAHAKNVAICLEFLDKMLNIRINDDGVGFNAEAVVNRGDSHHESGFGLYSMKERVHLLNGHLDIISFPNKGTTIFASIPLEGGC